MSGIGDAYPLRRLDVRGLDPPEPMRKALEAIEALGPGGALEVITDREPLLLYREFRRRGYPYVSESGSDGFRTTIRRSARKSEP